MKKILVVLLILAVSTGVFAQGTWTLSSRGEIGARVDFKPTDATVGGSAYNTPYEEYSAIKGSVGIGYSLGNFTGNIGIGSHDGLDGTATIKGENYQFVWSGFLVTFFENLDGADWTRNRRLWGEYKMINQMVTLEAAYNSRDAEYWVSDKTGAFYGVDAINQKGYAVGRLHNFGNDQSKTFTKVDHHNYLLGNISLAGLEFGMILPNFFMTKTWNTDTRKHEGWWSASTTADADYISAPADSVTLIEGVLKNAVVGAKFTMAPIEVAAQFMMKDYGVYLGGKFLAGPLTAGLSFMGIMKTDTHIKAGLSVDYNGGAFGAGLRGKVDVNKVGTTTSTTIGAEPEFFYNAIPTHLQFKLNGGFYFYSVNANGSKAPMEVSWGVQPQIFWNFLGTGAGSYHGFNTGMIVRYRVFKDVTNALDLVFEFGL